jgi:amino acid permease
VVWATLFCYLCLLPISLPRQLQALRYSGLIGFGISLYVVFVIFFLSFKHEDIIEGKLVEYPFSERMDAAWNEPKVNMWGIFNSLPLILFSYMYQPNIPAIYGELNRRHLHNMKKVLAIGTGLASIAYILVGMFGYVTFAKNPQVCQIMEA